MRRRNEMTGGGAERQFLGRYFSRTVHPRSFELPELDGAAVESSSIAFVIGGEQTNLTGMPINSSLVDVLSSSIAIPRYPALTLPSASSFSPSSPPSSSLVKAHAKQKLWLHLVGPSVADLRELSPMVRMDPVTLMDVTANRQTKSRVIPFDHYRYVTNHEIVHEDKVEVLHILLYDNLIVTIQPKKQVASSWQERNDLIASKYGVRTNTITGSTHLDPTTAAGAGESLPAIVKQTIRQLEDDKFAIESPDVVTVALVCGNVSRYEERVEAAELEGANVEDLVSMLSSNADDAGDVVRRITVAKSKTRLLFWFLQAKSAMLRQLVQGKLSTSASQHLRHASNAVEGMIFRLNVVRETIDGARDSCLHTISLESARTADFTNRVMKRFSAVATVMMPLTLMTGLFGMNVTVLGGWDHQHTEHKWFFSILASCILFTIISLLVMRFLEMRQS